jgi:hypothetical protein
MSATYQLDGQITKSLSIPSRENIPLAPSGKSVIESARLTADEGRWPSSRTRGEMQWTRIAQKTSAHDAYGEVVWS